MEVSQWHGEQVVSLRYNPPACQCTPWEVKLGEQWIRGELSAAGSSGDEAMAALTQAALANPDGEWRAQGDVDGRLALDAQLNRPTVRLSLRALIPQESIPIGE
jgi:hypothetical protein